MGNTRTLLCFLDVDNSEGRREKGNGTKEKEQNRKVGQPTIGKNNLRERKEKQSRLEMCIDVEYVQKKCTRTYIAAISRIFLFLNFRTRVRSRVLILRNVANREKERTQDDRYELHHCGNSTEQR